MSVGPRIAFNHALDRVTRPSLVWRGQRISLFKVLGYIGLSLAVLLSVSLVAYRGLPLWVMGAVILSSISTFYALAMITRILVGEERLVYYHHEIAVISVAAGLLAIAGQPVLAYLDATILGIGIFLVCGRIGCFMVGCCHGMASTWGVCYREEHAQAGFASHMVGVRLLPIQLVESLWVLCIVVTGSGLVLAGEPAGSALAFYVVAYDLGRFILEFVRGDLTRPYFLGISEAQWISLFLLCMVIMAEWVGILPFHTWHAGVAGAMLLVTGAILLWRQLGGRREPLLTHPHHIMEMLSALDRLESGRNRAGVHGATASPGEVTVAKTSLGMQISSAIIQAEEGLVGCYSVSRPGRALGEEAAESLLVLIGQLRTGGMSARIIRGQHQVYHLCTQQYLPVNGTKGSDITPI